MTLRNAFCGLSRSFGATPKIIPRKVEGDSWGDMGELQFGWFFVAEDNLQDGVEDKEGQDRIDHHGGHVG